MSRHWKTIILAPIQPDFMPKQAHETDAGFDVKAWGNYIIAPHSLAVIGLRVKVAMPKWKVCLLVPRSSLFKKKGLIMPNSIWIIDAWYRNEVKMQVYNMLDEECIIEHWERVWQLIFVDYTDNSWNNFFQENKHYDDFEDEYPSDRWVNWFGSTWN